MYEKENVKFKPAAFQHNRQAWRHYLRAMLEAIHYDVPKTASSV